MPKVARAVRVLSVPPLTRVDRHVRARAHWSGSTLIVALTIGVLVAGGLPLLRSPFGVPVAGSEPGDGRRSVPVEIAALAASSVPTASPVAAYPYTTPPPPGVTPSPEPDPGRYSPAGIPLAATSSSRVLAVQIGKELIPGYQTVSFRLSLTLGSDFATRLDRSIRLYGSDNIRYLADEAVGAYRNAYDPNTRAAFCLELKAGRSRYTTRQKYKDLYIMSRWRFPIIILRAPW